MATFIAEIKVNLHAIDYTPGSAASAGGVVVQGELVGILPSDLAAGEKGALMIQGEAEFPKDSGDSTALDAGTIVYWDAADGEATDDADTGTNKHLGVVIADAADADEFVRVYMFPAGA